ncbi:MAG: hypothetical protein IIV17_06305 [Clostridia bacterium]|nr:hypothetical protein [Clostridia bacterium]
MKQSSLKAASCIVSRETFLILETKPLKAASDLVSRETLAPLAAKTADAAHEVFKASNGRAAPKEAWIPRIPVTPRLKVRIQRVAAIPCQKRLGSREPRPYRAKKSSDHVSRGHAAPKEAQIVRVTTTLCQNGHGSCKIEAAATKHRLFSITPPLTEAERPPPRATRKRKERRGKEKAAAQAVRRKSGEHSFLFILSFMQGSDERSFWSLRAYPGRGRGKSAAEKRGSLSSDKGCGREGRSKGAAASFRHSLHQKKERPFSGAFLLFFFCFFCPVCKVSPSLDRTSTVSSFGRATEVFFLSYGAAGVFFFLSDGLAGFFLPYSGFLSIAA